MKTLNRRLFVGTLGLFCLLAGGCKKDPGASIYDPNYIPGAQPVVSSVTLEGAPYALSGVTTIDLNGSNFSTDPSAIVVYFDATPVKVLSATPTLVRVKAPNFSKDSVKVRVSIVGVDKFSDTRYVSIKPAMVLADSIDFTKEQAGAVAVDRNGNIYVSLASTGGVGAGVAKFSPTGARTPFALKGAETFFSTLKVGAGDTVFAARRVAALYYLDPNVVAASKIYTTRAGSPPMGNIDDFDFDVQKNLWGGGNLNTGIYRINKFKQAREFPFANQVRALRVYNNALYVAARVLTSSDTAEIVYKFPINAADTGLGTAETYFNLTAQSGYRLNKITAITFDANGNLYVGTDGAAGILVVSGQNAAGAPLYGGLLGPNVLTFHWGTGTILYVVQSLGATSKTPQVLWKVDMQTQGAPYYGRQ